MSLLHPNRVALLAVALMYTAVLTPATASANGPDLYRIDFPGGTVAEYIELIRKTVDKINIVLMPDAGEVRIPALRLHTWPGNLQVFFVVLEYITHDAGPDELDVTRDGDLYFIRLESSEVESRDQTVSTHVASFSLAGVLIEDHVRADDALKSIEAVLAMRDDEPIEPMLRFHEPTSLLMVRGTHTQLNIVQGAIDQLKATANTIMARQGLVRVSRFGQGSVSSPSNKARQDEITERDAIIEELTQEVRELRERLRELEGKRE